MPEKKTEWIVEVYVTLKPSVLDPQGATIQRALHSMGHTDLHNVRMGKYFQLTYAAKLSRAEVEKQTKHICSKVLVNPVIEAFQFKLLTKGK